MAETKNSTIMLSDKTYELGKKLVQVVLPAISSAYFGLSSIWGLPSPEKVVGSLAVVTTFLGVMLGISSRNYDASGAAHDGVMNVSQEEDGKLLYSLELNDDVTDLASKDHISFKVQPQS